MAFNSLYKGKQIPFILQEKYFEIIFLPQVIHFQ